MQLNGTTIEQYMINIFWEGIKFPQDIINQCWEYIGSKDKDGYCYFSVKNRTRKAHRFSFVIHNPNIDITNKVVMHTCDNRSCVNPNHLKLGTNRDNVNDMLKKDRQLKGEDNGNSILTEDLVKNIIDRIISNQIQSSKQIMIEYELSRPHIHQILSGEIWTHITIPYSQRYGLSLNQVKNKIIQTR